MTNSLEARISKLERLIKESDYTYLEDSAEAAAEDLIYIEDYLNKFKYNDLKDIHGKSLNIGNTKLSTALYKMAQYWIIAKTAIRDIENIAEEHV
jgi:hypothetical protein